jgi:DNA-binding transcriptional regulator GbsR (MarR family)
VPAPNHARESLSRFIEQLGLYFEGFGLPRIAGRLLGLLIVTDHALPLDEIATRLQVSRASVSTNARLLLATRMIERVGVPGERRDFYAFIDRGWDAVIETDIDGVRTLRTLAAEALAGLGDEEPAARARLQDTVEFSAFYGDALATVLERWRARRMQTASGAPRSATERTV